VAVLHGSSSSDAAYPTCTLGTAALPAVRSALAVGTECRSDGGSPLSRPGSDVQSECATALRWPGPLLCPHLFRLSELHYRVQRLTMRILRHLTPEGYRRLWPPPAVLGNLHRHGSSAPSQFGLVLGILGSHSTARSTDPPPHSRRSPQFAVGVDQRRSMGALPLSSGRVAVSAR
jgi:hypothetical protein